MKSVILCAGEGKRSSCITGGENKCLTNVPGFGRIIDYSLKTALKLTREVIVLVGYRAGEVQEYVEDYTRAAEYESIVMFAQQPEPTGLCDGLLCCEHLIEGDDFLLLLGDEIITESKHEEMIESFTRNSAFAACGFVYAQNIDDVRKTYSIEAQGDRIVDLEEKPVMPQNNIMGTGNCLFTNAFLSEIRQYKKNAGANTRFSFPDVLRFAIKKDRTVISFEIGKHYLNFNCEEDIKVFMEQYK